MNVVPRVSMDKPAFLAWAQGREGRWELVAGRVVMMAGASRARGILVKNLLRLLDTRLDPRRWTVLADFGVDVGPETLRYPDVLIEPAGGHPKSLTTASPVFIAEVLSPSSTATDLGDKAAEYLRLDSLVAYVVLDQDEPKAWAWVRGDGGFPPGPVVLTGSGAMISVAALGLELPLSAIHTGIGAG
jgi:Uma2 family endonuclease